MVRPGREQMGHQGDDERLRDGLAMADRQRRVVIGVGCVPGRHQQVARDDAHRVEHFAVDPARAPHPGAGGQAGDGLDHAFALGGVARLRWRIRRGSGEQQRRDRDKFVSTRPATSQRIP